MSYEGVRSSLSPPIITDHFGRKSGAATARLIHDDKHARAHDAVTRKIEGSVQMVLREGKREPLLGSFEFAAKGGGKKGVTFDKTAEIATIRFIPPYVPPITEEGTPLKTMDKAGYMTLCFSYYRRLWPFPRGPKPLEPPPFASRDDVPEIVVHRDLLHYHYGVKDRIKSHDFPTIPRGALPQIDPLAQILKGKEGAGDLFLGSSQYLFGLEPSDPLTREVPSSFSEIDEAWVKLLKEKPLVAENPHRIALLVGLGTASTKYPTKGFAGCDVHNLLFSPRWKTRTSAQTSVHMLLNTLAFGRRLKKDDELTDFQFDIVENRFQPPGYEPLTMFTVKPNSLVIDSAFTSSTLHNFLGPAFLPLIRALRRGQNVLVFDDKGADRSVMFVLLFLMYFRGITLDQAFDFVREQKRLAFPSPLLWSVLREFERLMLVSRIIS